MIAAHHSRRALAALSRGEPGYDPGSYAVAPCTTCGDAPVRSVPAGCAHKSIPCGPTESEPCEGCAVHWGLCFGCDEVKPIVVDVERDRFCLGCAASLADFAARTATASKGRWA